MMPDASHCFFIFCCCLLHLYAIITITPCSSISVTTSRAGAGAEAAPPTTPTVGGLHSSFAANLTDLDAVPHEAGVALEHDSSSTKEKPAESPVASSPFPSSSSTADLDTQPQLPGPFSWHSENHLPSNLTEEAAAATETTRTLEAAACPADSVSVPGGGCVCGDSCPSLPPPHCMFRLEVVHEDGTLGTPGHCCPRYECVGCERDEDMLHGRCQCAKEALIDPLGRTCQCIDPHKTLVNGECVCDELKCRLPDMCNRKSVAVQVQEGCCKRTVCTPCPPDSESTDLDSDLIEDHCVCLPCHTNCGYNETAIVKQKGNGFPGSCCDLYECRQPGVREEEEDVEESLSPPFEVEEGAENAKADANNIYCLVGDVRHQNGATWTTWDQQICHCISGVSRCSSERMRELENPCFVDLKWYANGENWTKEDGCTQCICRNGEQQCISHFCEVKESHIHHSDGDDDDDDVGAPTATVSGGDVETLTSTACNSDDGRVHLHMDVWSENKDDCVLSCICYTGIKNCTEESGCLRNSRSSSSTVSIAPAPSSECQPLANCNKSCLNGYKINRKGCEICKCNAVSADGVADTNNDNNSGRFASELLAKYNISMSDLIRILDEYNDRRNSDATSTTSTTLSSNIDNEDNALVDDEDTSLSSGIWKEGILGGNAAVPEINKEAEWWRQLLSTAATVNGTKETVVKPTDPGSASSADAGKAYVIVSVACLAAVAAAVTAFAAACLYRSRRKSSSVDLTRCRYEHVDGGGRRGGGGCGQRTTTLNAAPTLLLLNNNNNDYNNTIKKTDPLL